MSEPAFAFVPPAIVDDRRPPGEPIASPSPWNELYFRNFRNFRPSRSKNQFCLDARTPGVLVCTLAITREG